MVKELFRVLTEMVDIQTCTNDKIVSGFTHIQAQMSEDK